MKPNKTEQIAEYLLAKGIAMTARDLFNDGFRFHGLTETTVSGISAIMNKMHCSSRYDLERKMRTTGDDRTAMVRVFAIRDASSYNKPGIKTKRSEFEMWRSLLCGKRIAV